jgi:hypothetical protein
MDVIHTPTRRTRLRRWLVALAVLLVLLAGYGVMLDRFAQRIGADVQKNMRSAPVVADDKHGQS